MELTDDEIVMLNIYLDDEVGPKMQALRERIRSVAEKIESERVAAKTSKV